MLQRTCIDADLIKRADRTARRLADAKLTLVTAESCTAGLLSAILAQTKYAGEILQGGFVTYSKNAKAGMLGLDAGLLQKNGAVTAKAAGDMCAGALARSNAEAAIAVTGVLGPSPDTDGNPVGLIYWAFARRGRRVLSVSKNYGAAPHDELMRHALVEALTLIDASIP